MHAFLLPAILGDEPQLVALRQALAGRIEFELLDLPNLDQRATSLCSMAETAGVLAGDIGRLQPTGAVALVGFSYGASLALEVAAQLTRSGRPVGCLGILDGAFRTDEMRRSKAELLRLCCSLPGLASLGWRLFERVNNRRRLLLATRFGPTADAPTPALREALLTDYRCKALNSWHPPACAAAGLLVFSGTLGAENRDRWTTLCPNLAIVDVAGKHGTFLTGPSLDRIVRALAEASAQGVRPRQDPGPLSVLARSNADEATQHAPAIWVASLRSQ